MSMNQIPTLVLGIGGVGCRTAAALSDLLSADDRRYVSVIGIDTNINELNVLKGKHQYIEIIQTSDDRDVNEYLEDHPDYKEWFPKNDFLRETTMMDGAGQIRTLSRLAFLESVERRRFDPIEREITRIRRVTDNPHSNNLVVLIIGSTTGGTGAGLFLSLPFYIRHLVKTEAGINRLTIRGMFVGPDITEEVQPSTTNKNAVCVNGYTCLKELNAFYMRPALGKKVTSNLRLEYYDPEDVAGKNVPYNYLYLLENSGNMGTIGKARLEEIQNYLARIAFVLLFTPLTSQAVSVEDNFVLQLIGDRGMNRYAGAGMCRLTYPVKTAQRYVALSVVRDLVRREWLLIDQKYDSLVQEVQSRMQTDRTVEMPKLKAAYIDLFREAALGEHAPLGRLAHEAFIQKNQKFISKGEQFIESLQVMIDDIFDSEEYKAKDEACKFDETKMNNITDAKKEISSVWDGMQDLAKFARLTVETRTGKFADTLFPATEKVMQSQKNSRSCIYGYLATVHPVTARFLIYDIINRLEEIINDAKSDLAGTKLDSYSDIDFDTKKEGVQSPQEYLSSLQESHDHFLNAMLKALGPVGKALSGEVKGLKRLKKKLNEAYGAHISMINSYIESGLKCHVAEILLKRLEELAENYAVFFRTLDERVKKNNDDILRMESLVFPYGQEGLYCTKEAFRQMAQDFILKRTNDLPDATKSAIFDKIFSIQSRAFIHANVIESDKEKEKRRREEKKSLEAVFNTAVIDSVKKDVLKQGDDIVNLTARGAMRKEFELKTHLYPDDDGYDEAVMAYAQKRISTAFKIASPMLTTDNRRESTEMNFLALSPDCAEKDDELKPDEARTGNFYLSNFGAQAHVIIDEEFEDTEIICLSLGYNYLIEDLVKYRAGARNEVAYRNRIADLEIKRAFDLNSEDLLITVNPHLDDNWDQEAFIPDIDGKQRIKDQENTLKAFVYAMGLDSFMIVKDDEHPDKNGKPRPTWYYCPNGVLQDDPIKKCGRIIGNSYYDLFDAIPYNRTIKKMILKEAERATASIKGYSSTEELFEGLLVDNTFILDLVQPVGTKDAGDKNIFDIFCEMRSHMPQEDWSKLFVGLLHTIWDFCGNLFDKNALYVNKATKIILTAIYENCTYVKEKSKTVTNKYKIALKSQYEKMLNEEYEVK